MGLVGGGLAVILGVKLFKLLLLFVARVDFLGHSGGRTSSRCRGGQYRVLGGCSCGGRCGVAQRELLGVWSSAGCRYGAGRPRPL